MARQGVRGIGEPHGGRSGDNASDPPMRLELAVTAWIYEAKPGAATRLFPILSKYVVMTRRAPGCINVDYLQATPNPAMFLIYEKWDAEASRDAHYGSELFRQSAADMAPHLLDPPTYIPLEVISAYDEGGLAPS